MELKPETVAQPNDEQSKRTYHQPKVIVYGNIREITQNLGPKGADDNGGGAAAGPKTGT